MNVLLHSTDKKPRTDREDEKSLSGEVCSAAAVFLLLELRIYSGLRRWLLGQPCTQVTREVLDAAARAIRPGITTDEIDEIVHEATVAAGEIV